MWRKVLQDPWQQVFGVVLAGGSGTRFWPKSRRLRPKQLCAISDPILTMIELTVARMEGLIPPERRIVVTHQDQLGKTHEILGDRVSTLLAEPEARNTLAALVWGAWQIKQKDPSGHAIMVSFHADHVIKNVEGFRQSLAKALEVARKGYLVCIGAKPTHPETGFGYLEIGDPVAQTQGFRVAKFKEKPDTQTAREYCKSGRYHWNTGIFVWNVSVLLDEVKDRFPSMHRAFSDLEHLEVPCDGVLALSQKERLGHIYRNLPSMPIDTAILEVSNRVAMVPSDAGWGDVGTWGAVADYRMKDEGGNAVYGPHCLVDSVGNIVDSDGPTIALLGVKDMIVVASEGALLVCPKEKAQDVKKIVERLTQMDRSDLL